MFGWHERGRAARPAGPPRTGGARNGVLSRLHRCERGQAIYVMVLFFFLLAGLLFLILNGGEKVNHKVQMQNAADSAAATGAAWYARGLNVASMANVTETQLLSLIVLCDTLESVVPPTVECIDDLMKNIGSSKAGHDFDNDDRFDDWLVVGNAASEQQIIRQFGDIVAAVNWPDYLTYDTGVLWECAKLMDGFSHAMAKDTPLAAQRESIDIAEKNHADFGFLLPLWPALPVVNGQWLDFYWPMRYAAMPPTNRDRRRRGPLIGGFAWVMDYRGYHGQVMGPWGYWREPFTDSRPMGLFDISRFSVLFRIVSDAKLEMMFNASADDKVTLKRWEMDYDKAKGYVPPELRRAWWERLSFDARYPQANDSADPWQPENLAEVKPPFPPPATGDWNIKRWETEPDPYTRSYRTMTQPSLSGYTRATQSWEGADAREALWYRVTPHRTAHYPQLGIFAPHPPLNPDGTPWPYTDAEMKTYYQVSFWRFDGAELQTDETLHRRYVGSGTVPLAPILLDPNAGDNLTAHISQRFTFDGFAYRSGKVVNWTERFINPNPVEDLVAYAQARVYNRYSWDLFTQHWKVKLMRADRWKALLPELEKSIPGEGADVAAKLTPDRLKSVRQTLEYYDDPFVQEVTH